MLGVVGGVGFGFAGPSVLFTESMLLARLFMTTVAMALWMVGAGVLLRRRASTVLAATGTATGARVGQHAGT